MKNALLLVKSIAGNYERLFLSIICILFVLPVHYAIWKRRNPGKGIEQYLGEADVPMWKEDK